jgi:excinuclease ABC subunit B
LIVASVSCIYNLGSPDAYRQSTLRLYEGQIIPISEIKEQLIKLQYERNDLDLKRRSFRVKGDTLELYPAYEEFVVRASLFGDKVESLTKLDSRSLEKIENITEITVFPARHYNIPLNLPYDPIEKIKAEFKTWSEKLKKENRLLELQRITSRTKYDLEMIKEIGTVKGIENYSRYFDGRNPGEPPYTLLDYFPKDYLIFIDESHMSLPQIRGMWHGERSRKETLIDNGFRLPSAMDNRPLTFDEFMRKVNQMIFFSATPNEYELSLSDQVAEQIVRPTGLVDPEIEVRPTENQIPNLLEEIGKRVNKKQRVLITTLTKRMAEDLTEYLQEKDIKVMYIHHEVDTLERVDILRDLRLGKYDCLVGINLLREGLDLPEVSLVAIVDADKEGFLRSKTSLVQTIGRAARHVEGKVIMYADNMTDSIKAAIEETDRRREIQKKYNEEHHITPATIQKAIHDIGERLRELQPDVEVAEELDLTKVPKDQIKQLIRDLTREMKAAAERQEFERAALLLDQLNELKSQELEIPRTVSVKEAKKIKI